MIMIDIIRRLRKFFDRKKQSKIVKECQFCKSTDTEPEWRCTLCGRYLCKQCVEGFKSVGKEMECFYCKCTPKESEPEGILLSTHARLAARKEMKWNRRTGDSIARKWKTNFPSAFDRYAEGVSKATGVPLEEIAKEIAIVEDDEDGKKR